MWIVYPQSVTHCQRRLAAKFQFIKELRQVVVFTIKAKSPGSSEEKSAMQSTADFKNQSGTTSLPKPSFRKTMEPANPAAMPPAAASASAEGYCLDGTPLKPSQKDQLLPVLGKH